MSLTHYLCRNLPYKTTLYMIIKPADWFYFSLLLIMHSILCLQPFLWPYPSVHFLERKKYWSAAATISTAGFNPSIFFLCVYCIGSVVYAMQFALTINKSSVLFLCWWLADKYNARQTIELFEISNEREKKKVHELICSRTNF